MPEPSPFEAAVIAVMEATTPGDVLSYGDVAAEAGYPGAARAVTPVLGKFNLPWWRVVTANGRLVPNAVQLQAQHLKAEGVTVKAGHVVAQL